MLEFNAIFHSNYLRTKDHHKKDLMLEIYDRDLTTTEDDRESEDI